MQGQSKVRDHLDRLEVLSDIYQDMAAASYINAAERDIAKLKMELVKKEMLVLTYLIDKETETIQG
jgi:hypothetical protein